MISTDNVVADKIGYGTSGGGYHHAHFPNYGFSGGHGNYGYEYHSGGGKKSIALSALTLLAFLFFLHILQTCVQEHIDNMNTPVVVMATRENTRVKTPNRQTKGEIETMDYKDEFVWDQEDRELDGRSLKGRNLYEQIHKVKAKVKVIDEDQ